MKPKFVAKICFNTITIQGWNCDLCWREEKKRKERKGKEMNDG